MAKRQRETREPTKKQTMLARRDREMQQRVFIGIGATAALVLIVLAFGLLQQFVLLPNSPVATVDGQSISTAAYQTRVKYQRAILENQLAQYQQFQQQFDPQGTSNFFTSQIQQIQQQLSNPETFGLNVLDTMVDDILIREEARKRNITIDPATLQKEIEKSFGYEPDATPTPVETPRTITSTQVITTSAGVTQTEVVSATVTPAPTPTPFTAEAYQTLYNQTLENVKATSGMTEAEFRSLTEDRLLRDAVQAAVTADVPTTEEEIHARHILITVAQDASDADKAAAKAKAEAALQRIKNGEPFDVVAKEVSEDTSTAAQGGDLGWFGRGRMVTAFEDAAFALEPGQVSDVVETQFGYHIIQVLEKDPNHPLSESDLQAKKDQAFQDWLTQARSAATIERFWDTSKIPPTPTGQTIPVSG